MAYLRTKNTCLGCRVPDPHKAISIQRCKILNCEVMQSGAVAFCYECANFPCPKIKHLDKRYRARYSTSVIENLEVIRDSGMSKFLENQAVRWTCPDCGGVICMHTGSCFACGKKR